MRKMNKMIQFFFFEITNTKKEISMKERKLHLTKCQSVHSLIIRMIIIYFPSLIDYIYFEYYSFETIQYLTTKWLAFFVSQSSASVNPLFSFAVASKHSFCRDILSNSNAFFTWCLSNALGKSCLLATTTNAAYCN